MIVQHKLHQYNIEGVVDFATVPDLLQQAEKLITASDTAENKPLAFDFATVESCNSAALALILEMLKHGKQAKLTLQFENIPDALLKIATVYGIETEIREIFK